MSVAASRRRLWGKVMVGCACGKRDGREALALTMAIAVGGWSIARFLIEERRQAQLAHADISGIHADLEVLLYFMRSAAFDFRNPLREDLAEGDESPAVIEQLKGFNLSRQFLLPGPLIGFRPISPPGDTRPIINILSDEAARVAEDLDRIRREHVTLIANDVPTLLETLINALFFQGLIGAKAEMASYHQIEDSESVPFFLLGNPLVAQESDYVAFVDLLTTIERRVSALRN
ncbi:MAG: hypothetical protein ACH37Z_04285 [Anaerolineae bacterium]